MPPGQAASPNSQRVVPLPPPPPGRSETAVRPPRPIGPWSSLPGPWRVLFNPEAGFSFLASLVFHALLLAVLGLLLLRASGHHLFHGPIASGSGQPAVASSAGTAVGQRPSARPIGGDAAKTALEPANGTPLKGNGSLLSSLVGSHSRRSQGSPPAPPSGEIPRSAPSDTATAKKTVAEKQPLTVSVPKPVHVESPQPTLSSVDVPAGTDLLATHDVSMTGSLDGRDIDTRATSAARGGGNVASEKAVEQGLRWLVAHQLENGSWHFDFDGGMCHGQCRNPGSVATTTGATALALLPFLGAGYTHKKGEYRENVVRGLYYLNTRTQFTANGGDVREGTLYSQALAGIALAEAYAMTGDHEIKGFAQSVLDFIVYAQDKNGGGWRYEPGAPGDMTVTGWQLMALKCGQMAGLRVPKPTLYMVTRFLDHVQTNDGAGYGYMTPQSKPTTSAIGLLCRMYTGWRRNHPMLIAGVANLTRWGPSQDNIYYDYYATQVLFHRQGPEWEAWNRQLRDFLVATQAATGHESGSWYFPGGHGDKAGRLFGTAMAIMTLEVYYRYLPLYSHESVSGF
jgi:hypothetical protein